MLVHAWAGAVISVWALHVCQIWQNDRLLLVMVFECTSATEHPGCKQHLRIFVISKPIAQMHAP